MKASKGCPDIASGAVKPLREAYGKPQVAFFRLPEKLHRESWAKLVKSE